MLRLLTRFLLPHFNKNHFWFCFALREPCENLINTAFQSTENCWHRTFHFTVVHKGQHISNTILCPRWWQINFWNIFLSKKNISFYFKELQNFTPFIPVFSDNNFQIGIRNIPKSIYGWLSWSCFEFFSEIN